MPFNQVLAGRVFVENEERVAVPKLLEEEPHAIANGIDREAVAVPGLLGGEEIPAHRVGAEAVQDLPRLNNVADRLAHLAVVFVTDVAEADDRLVGRLAEEQS